MMTVWFLQEEVLEHRSRIEGSGTYCLWFLFLSNDDLTDADDDREAMMISRMLMMIGKHRRPFKGSFTWCGFFCLRLRFIYTRFYEMEWIVCRFMKVFTRCDLLCV